MKKILILLVLLSSTALMSQEYGYYGGFYKKYAIYNKDTGYVFLEVSRNGHELAFTTDKQRYGFVEFLKESYQMFEQGTHTSEEDSNFIIKRNSSNYCMMFSYYGSGRYKSKGSVMVTSQYNRGRNDKNKFMLEFPVCISSDDALIKSLYISLKLSKKDIDQIIHLLSDDTLKYIKKMNKQELEKSANYLKNL